MADTFTPNAKIRLPANNDPSWDLLTNNNWSLVDAQAAIGGGAVTTTEVPSATLNVAVAALTFVNRAGAFVTYAGTPSQAMTASNTNYLYLTDAGVLTVNTTGFPASTNIVPLATVVAGTASITSITDARRPFPSAGGAPIVFGPSGTGHSAGAVPDPGSSAGTTHFLCEDGTWKTTGTVTSVALAMPGLFSVAGSPVTGAGTFTVSLANQSANTVLAGPGSGGAAAPTFRTLVVADLPTTGLVIDSSSGTITTDIDGATITFDCGASDKHAVTLGGNRTLALTGDSVGQWITVLLTQDATGSRTVTWWSGILWPGGTAPTLTTTASKTDAFRFLKTGAGAYLGFILGQNM